MSWAWWFLAYAAVCVAAWLFLVCLVEERLTIGDLVAAPILAPVMVPLLAVLAVAIFVAGVAARLFELVLWEGSWPRFRLPRWWGREVFRCSKE